MTRASVIVSLWLLLTGGIGDAALTGDRSPLWLLAFYFGISLLTAGALWLEYRDDDAPRAGLSRRRRERLYHYD
ncbi:hypothetical protein [Anaeromyxobacter diazotrophicus]|uniref:Uncharacterized protein n=1 Tax=Anaeromyxobacter diazotrophicus TaxID=2590199 RepID=A0A7I9VJ73_9BACT|nr:hypothetical protein [Anaeromyxobacter diazotrophicus]GEJ56415.1 hypothetical protein AMYX_11560 [Anaeromyxobacter diazotrophicus]